ncbi:Putative hydroxymethylpyrimidine/phosphomethylpyrimidine kinase 2 [Cladobotryum mycophilum]|uniref:Hydroxymethylpyrimidine/phosphomethylpyrimidine kinase 2 n=1 Tax=Cladobotryum mycophilum TaxID=491253 RepID=A0ABR0SQW4_9HYPO
MTATTALTVQNTTGVKGVHVIPAEFVGQQIEACIEDIGVDVVKTGMLASAETIEIISKLMVKHKVPALVVDPVMVSTSGAQLLPQEAIKELVEHLLPHTTILTPNIPEANLLLSHIDSSAQDIQSVDDIESIARKIQALGPKWVLVKGGHLPFRADLTVARTDEEKKAVVDVLVGPSGEVFKLESSWQQSTSTHGTGCSLASAIAARLAQGMDVPMAVRAACRYIEAAIRAAPNLGAGHGPLDHFHSTYTLPFSPGYFVEYLLEHPVVKDAWKGYLHHPFVMALGNGTLPLDSFKGYIVQDYLYLIHFARAVALGAYKSKDLKEIARSSEVVAHIIRETSLHVEYCKSFGISEAEIIATEEHPACTAYTRYVLEVGQSEDWLALQMSLAPCLLGYGALAKMLEAHVDTVRDGNVYWKWIESYAGAEYGEAVKIGNELLEKYIVLQSPSRIEELVKIFAHATKMEIEFWEMYAHK